MTVDEGPAAMKTGSHGDGSDSDAAVMSTDQLMHRLLAAEHDAFTSQCRYMSTLSPANAGTCQQFHQPLQVHVNTVVVLLTHQHPANFMCRVSIRSISVLSPEIVWVECLQND